MLFSEIQTLDSLSFSFQITVHRIVLEEDEQIFYERNVMASDKAIEWKIDREKLQTLQTCPAGKQIWSQIYGGTYRLEVLL